MSLTPRSTPDAVLSGLTPAVLSADARVRAPFAAALGPGEAAPAAFEGEAGGWGFDWRFEPAPGGLLSRLRLTNRTASPRRLDAVTLAAAEAADGGDLAPGVPMREWAFYQHGWMSWAPTIIRRVVGPDRFVAPDDARYRLWNAPAGPGLVSSEVTLVGTARLALLAGLVEPGRFVSALELVAEEGGFGRFAVSILTDGLTLAPGETFEPGPVYWAYGEPETLLAAYAELSAPHRAFALPRGGFCTWYTYYGRNDEADLSADLAAMRRPEAAAMDWVIVDDGHQTAIGDWLSTDESRFPAGMRRVAADIAEAGRVPGLWLAPFCVGANSRLYAEHPDWVVRDAAGAPFVVMEHWGTEVFGLDGSHPEAIAHLRGLFATLTRVWGFRVLKLDFLHVGAQPGIRHEAMSRLAAFQRGLAAIREAVGPEVHLLGCGAPLGACLGLVDSMRVSQDVGSTWASVEPEDMSTVSTYHAAMNTVLRLWQHGRWWVNDPDCLLIRDDGQAVPDTPPVALTEAERTFLRTVVALTGGTTISGDGLAQLSDRRWRQTAQVMPPTGLAARWVRGFTPDLPPVLHLPLAADWDGWHLVGLLNWDDEPREVAAPFTELGLAGVWEVYDVWEGRPRPEATAEVRLMLPPHGAGLLALRRQRVNPWLLGDDRHFSQGFVGVGDCRWSDEAMALALTLLPTPNRTGSLWLSVPEAYRFAGCDGLSPQEGAAAVSPAFVRLDLDVGAPRELAVRFVLA